MNSASWNNFSFVSRVLRRNQKLSISKSANLQSQREQMHHFKTHLQSAGRNNFAGASRATRGIWAFWSRAVTNARRRSLTSACAMRRWIFQQRRDYNEPLQLTHKHQSVQHRINMHAALLETQLFCEWSISGRPIKCSRTHARAFTMLFTHNEHYAARLKKTDPPAQNLALWFRLYNDWGLFFAIIFSWLSQKKSLCDSTLLKKVLVS